LKKHGCKYIFYIILIYFYNEKKLIYCEISVILSKVTLTFSKLLINYLFTYVIFATVIKFTKKVCTDNSVHNCPFEYFLHIFCILNIKKYLMIKLMWLKFVNETCTQMWFFSKKPKK